MIMGPPRCREKDVICWLGQFERDAEGPGLEKRLLSERPANCVACTTWDHTTTFAQ